MQQNYTNKINTNMGNIATEEYQKIFDEKVNAVLKVLEGLNSQYAKSILEAAIYRLPAHSCVQLPQALQ